MMFNLAHGLALSNPDKDPMEIFKTCDGFIGVVAVLEGKVRKGELKRLIKQSVGKKTCIYGRVFKVVRAWHKDGKIMAKWEFQKC